MRMSLCDETNMCVIVPTYNNEKTIIEVLERVLLFSRHVLVVDDGSTDRTPFLLEHARLSIIWIRHRKNQGKGYALKTGFLRALELGFAYAVTIDADGQHFPEDIPVLVDAARLYPEALIVGSRNLKSKNMPGKNVFANRFSNFWFRLQTGQSLQDTQTGFRLYPLARLKGLKYLTSRYEAELELLVLSAWHGIKLHPVSVRVYYPTPGERVSHFRPITDFLRISLVNTLFCIGAVGYGWPLRMLSYFRRNKS